MGPKASPRVSPSIIGLTLPLHHSKLITRVKGLLVSLLRGWKERSASSVMAINTSKRIVPTRELSPLER